MKHSRPRQIPEIITTLITLCIVVCGVTTSDAANGELFLIDNCRVLQVWGSHSEMGYAQGFYLGKDIVDLATDYIFTIVSPEDYESVVLPVFRLWMRIPDRFNDEIEALYTGMIDSGTNIYVEELERDLTAEDIGAVNAIVDLWGFGFLRSGSTGLCSSICGYGNGTSTDPDTPNGTIHCRDMDWQDTDDYLLGNTSLIIAYMPSDPDEQNWISVTIPGFIGCLSGMNIHGTGATLNMGDHDINPGVTSNQNPICLQLRESLECIDPNDDGLSNAQDVSFILNSQSRVPSTIIHAFGTALDPDSLYPPALVVESNYGNFAERFPSNDPVLAPDFLAATNTHRVLYSPASCWRYSLIQSMISEDYKMSTSEAWEIERAVSWSGTIQTMLFRPDIMNVMVAFATNPTPAPYQTPSILEWDDMFQGTPTPSGTAPTPTPEQATMTPAASPSPDPSITPSPPSTATPGCDYTSALMLNKTIFHPDDRFYLQLILENTCEEISIDQFILLDIYGDYFYWPSWDSDFDYNTLNMPSGNMHLTIFDFIWPEVQGSVSGLYFWSAAFEPDHFDIDHIIGEVTCIEFGYSEEF